MDTDLKNPFDMVSNNHIVNFDLPRIKDLTVAMYDT